MNTIERVEDLEKSVTLILDSMKRQAKAISFLEEATDMQHTHLTIMEQMSKRINKLEEEIKGKANKEPVYGGTSMEGYDGKAKLVRFEIEKTCQEK